LALTRCGPQNHFELRTLPTAPACRPGTRLQGLQDPQAHRQEAEGLEEEAEESHLQDRQSDKVKKKEGVTAKTGKVVKQNPKPGKILAPGSKVSVKLGG
jgi:PASTA domain